MTAKQICYIIYVAYHGLHGYWNIFDSKSDPEPAKNYACENFFLLHSSSSSTTLIASSLHFMWTLWISETGTLGILPRV